MQVLISAEAQSEFRHAVKFYEKRQKGLGKKFSNAVKSKSNFLQSNPKAAEIKYLQIRVTTVKGFPFTIHYTHSDKQILIVAIFHNSRHPDQLIR